VEQGWSFNFQTSRKLSKTTSKTDQQPNLQGPVRLAEKTADNNADLL